MENRRLYDPKTGQWTDEGRSLCSEVDKFLVGLFRKYPGVDHPDLFTIIHNSVCFNLEILKRSKQNED